MNITIRPQGTTAIYEQIINQMKNAIVTHELKAGEALPSIRALAASLEVSVITTKRAYEELEKEGLIYSKQGKGFFVCTRKLEMLKEKKIQDLEKRMSELIKDCKSAELSKSDVMDMLDLLYDEEQQ